MSAEQTQQTAPSIPVQTPAPPPPEKPPAPPAPVEPAPGAKDWNAIRAQQEQLRRQREELKTQTKAAEDAKRFADEVKRLAKENPEEAAKLLGIDYRAWTMQRLNGGKKDPVTELRSELERFKQESQAEREKEAKSREEERGKQIEAHWGRVTSDFTALVKDSGDTHAFLRSELEADKEYVFQTLREMAAAKPELTVPEAADLYEKYLVGRYVRLNSLTKAKTLAPVAPAAEPKKQSNDSPRAETGDAGTGNGARTLTNGHAQERTAPAEPPKNKNRLRAEAEADEDRIRRAMALLR